LDFKIRLNRLNERLAKGSAYFCASSNDLFYLTGFRGTFGRLICLNNRNYFLTDRRYDGIAQNLPISGSADIIISSDPFKDIIKILKNAKSVLLSNDTPLSSYLSLKNKSKIISGIVKEMRLIKDNDEVSLIRKAAEINGKAVLHCTSILKEGITEYELAIEFESFVKRNGAEGASFSTISAFSGNGAIPHAMPSDRILKKGDTVLLDCGVKYRGYCSDLTRVIAFGIIDSRFKKYYEIVRQAKKEALTMYKSGLIIRKADLKARQSLKKHGLDALFTHSLGHGMGIDVHEAPSINKKEASRFRAGMTVTCEPGIYIKGKYGIRIEDDYLITAEGNKAEKLSIIDDNLIIKD